MTQSPIASISPSSSAIGMNSPGGTVLCGIAPPDQRLQARDRAIREVDDWLPVQDPVLMLHRTAQSGGQRQNARRRRRPAREHDRTARLRLLRWYMAVSAFFSRLVASVASCGKRLTPSRPT